MMYSLSEKQRMQKALNLDTLPDDEFMELAAQVKVAAAAPRGRPRGAVTTAPSAIAAEVAEATVGSLLEQAKEAKHRSNTDIAKRLHVSRQRVAEILTSRNLELSTVVATAAAIGYETRISLHPIDNSGPDFEAVLNSPALAELR